MEKKKEKEKRGKKKEKYLNEEEKAKANEDRAALVVNGMNANDMDGRGEGDEDHGTDGFEQVKLVTHVERELGVEEGDGDDDELDGHEVAEDLENDFEHRPFLCLHQAPGARGEDEGIPCGDGERTDEEILVCAQMGGQVEVGREESRDVVRAHRVCSRRTKG